MPKILDLFDNTVRDVPQNVYDQWIQQTGRFAIAPSATPEPSVIFATAPSTASDLVGTGTAPEPTPQHVVDSMPLGPLQAWPSQTFTAATPPVAPPPPQPAPLSPPLAEPVPQSET